MSNIVVPQENVTEQRMNYDFERIKSYLKNKNTSLEVGENDIKFITPAGINYWSTHTAIGNLGAPTSPPTPVTIKSRLRTISN